MTRHSKVFVPVSDKKFEDSGLYIVIGEEWSDTPFKVMALNGRLYDVDFQGDDGKYNTDVTDYVTYWLEEKENVYVLTEEELKEIRDALSYGEMEIKKLYKSSGYLNGNLLRFIGNALGKLQSKTNPQT